MIIQVDCHAGYRGEEYPRRIVMGSNTIDVADIEDRWMGPDHRYFKVLGGDGALYIIRNDFETQVWELIYFKHPDTPEDGLLG